MKTFLYLFVLSFFIIQCKSDEPRGVLLEYTARQFEIPAGLNPIFLHGFSVGPISTEHGRFETLTGTQWEDWSRIEPARSRLQINERGLDWSFVREVSIKAYTDDPATAKEIFYRDQIPVDVGVTLDLIPTDFDANLDLFDQEEVTLLIELVRLRSSPPQSIPVTMFNTYEAFQE